MQRLEKNELEEIKGGGFWKAVAIIAGVVFVIGLIDGIVNPKRCN